MKFNIYKIKVKQKNNGGLWNAVDNYHKLIHITTFKSYAEAEEWLKANHEKYVDYTILPTYYFTHYDEQS